MNTEKLNELQSEYGDNIIAQVVRIISPSEIIIDLSEASAIKNEIDIGSKIEIFSILDELKDSDGNSLGKYTNVKSKAKISRIEKQYSVCCPLEVNRIPPVAMLTGSMTTSPGYFNVDKEDIKPFSQQTTKTIKINDLVRTIK